MRTGELIAAISAVALLIIMFAFSWYGLEDAPAGTGGLNAWESYGFIDIILFVTIVVAIGLAIATAMAQTVALPVAASAVTAGLGILSTLLILFHHRDPGPGASLPASTSRSKRASKAGPSSV